MVPVIEVCIRPRVGEDEAVAETTIPSVAVSTPVSGPTQPVQLNLDFNIQERINTFLGQVDTCETRRNIVRSVTDLMAGFNDLLSQTPVPQSPQFAVPVSLWSSPFRGIHIQSITCTSVVGLRLDVVVLTATGAIRLIL